MTDCKKLTIIAALASLSFGSASSLASTLPEDASAASVYAYFRIADGDIDTSLSPDQFKAQLDEITGKTPAYSVLPLGEIISRQKANQSLPRRTIALTFDQPDQDFLATIAPALEQKSLPYTIFISPGQIDSKSAGGLSWDDLRSLAASGHATIGLSAYEYGRTSSLSTEKLTADINQAKGRFREELQQDAAFFAYPYGDMPPAYVDLISKQGFKAAFGQQSGVTNAGANPFTLPRFTMTSEFGDLERFRMTSQALPFPVSDMEPASPVLTSNNPPFPGFTAPATLSAKDLGSMTCFASGLGKVPVQVLGHNRVELRPEGKFEDSRGRINCTLPVASAEDSRDVRWRWLGFLFSIPGNIKPDSGGTDVDFPSPEQP